MENQTEQDIEAQMLEAMAEEGQQAEGPADVEAVEADAVPVAQAAPVTPAAPAKPVPAQREVSAADHFEDLSGNVADGDSAPLSTLYDLSLPISIELGRTSMKVQEVLHLGRGSVIELDRLAGEPVDVYVGDRRFAEGEVVVLGENFGVRITRILPATGGEAA